MFEEKTETLNNKIKNFNINLKNHKEKLKIKSYQNKINSAEIEMNKYSDGIVKETFKNKYEVKITNLKMKFFKYRLEKYKGDEEAREAKKNEEAKKAEEAKKNEEAKKAEEAEEKRNKVLASEIKEIEKEIEEIETEIKKNKDILSEYFLIDIKTFFDFIRNLGICIAMISGFLYVYNDKKLNFIFSFYKCDFVNDFIIGLFLSLAVTLFFLNIFWLWNSLNDKGSWRFLNFLILFIIIIFISFVLGGVPVINVVKEVFNI
jgi:DNA polymerase III alpha subunit (gram-positive type)